MRCQSRKQTFPPLAVAAGAILLHLAGPTALFGQNRATMRVTTTVLPAEAVWEAQELETEAVQHLINEVTASADRSEPLTAHEDLPEAIQRNDPVVGDGAEGLTVPISQLPLEGLGAGTEPPSGLPPVVNPVAFRKESGGTVVWLERTDPGAAVIMVAHLAN